MWKAIAGLLVGIVAGLLFSSQLYAEKNDLRIVGDTNRDGVVEFNIPLSHVFSYKHICCACGLTHTVTTQIVLGPLGLPWLHQRWEIDEMATRRERTKKFGPDWMRSDEGLDDFGRLH